MPSRLLHLWFEGMNEGKKRLTIATAVNNCLFSPQLRFLVAFLLDQVAELLLLIGVVTVSVFVLENQD